MLDAGKLFPLRDFSNPINFNDEDNWANIIVSNLEREENIVT